MRNALRTFIVGLMVFALLFNPAMACHFCGGWGGHYASQPAYYYGSSCCGSYEVVVADDCGGCGSCGNYDSCGGCDSCDTCDSCGTAVVEEHTSMPVEEAAPRAPEEAPAEVRPALPESSQPSTVERPVEEPVVPMTPPQTPPAVEPAPITPPATETAPLTPPAAPEENLFDSTEDAVTPPASAVPPAAEPADTEIMPPAETPVETDDLFGSPSDAPVETPVEPPATEDSTDDLFGGESAPAETPAATDDPAETTDEAPAEESKEEETDDIFGARNILREAGGLASSEHRVWVDNTGRYSVNARLLQMTGGHVRLMKDNGRTTTVPINRLSVRDLEFVNRQASAQKATAFRTAQTFLGMPVAAN